MLTIVDVHTYDIRFPTSRTLAGSDAMHSDPDYACTGYLGYPFQKLEEIYLSETCTSPG
jgi:hypothetical protein